MPETSTSVPVAPTDGESSRWGGATAGAAARAVIGPTGAGAAAALVLGATVAGTVRPVMSVVGRSAARKSTVSLNAPPTSGLGATSASSARTMSADRHHRKSEPQRSRVGARGTIASSVRPTFAQPRRYPLPAAIGYGSIR